MVRRGLGEELACPEPLAFLLGSFGDRGRAWLRWENTVLPTAPACGPGASFSVPRRLVLVRIKDMAENVT